MARAEAKKGPKRRLPPDAATEETRAFLKSAGWHPAPDGWRNRKLSFPWPAADAAELQREADNGRQDQIHRILRGE